MEATKIVADITTPDEIYVRVVRREEGGLNGFGLILGASFVFVPQRRA